MAGAPPLESAPDPLREAGAVWAGVILALAALQGVALAVPWLRPFLGAAAVAAFLWTPMRFLERRGQDAHSAGWRFDRLGPDLAWGLGACAVVLPLFTLAFWKFPGWIPALPAPLQALLAPYAAAHPLRIAPVWSWDFAGRLGGNAAVAFAEEFFYRGYMTLRFEERWSPLRTALAVAALFAVGHLLQPALWRLLVFFPALLFAWIRRRTGTVVGASIAHFLCNAWLLVLTSS